METDIDQTTIALYNKLLPKMKDAIWHDGSWTYKQITGADAWRLMGWTWELGNQGVLVVVNFSEV